MQRNTYELEDFLTDIELEAEAAGFLVIHCKTLGSLKCYSKEPRRVEQPRQKLNVFSLPSESVIRYFHEYAGELKVVSTSEGFLLRVQCTPDYQKRLSNLSSELKDIVSANTLSDTETELQVTATRVTPKPDFVKSTKIRYSKSQILSIHLQAASVFGVYLSFLILGVGVATSLSAQGDRKDIILSRGFTFFLWTFSICSVLSFCCAVYRIYRHKQQQKNQS